MDENSKTGSESTGEVDLIFSTERGMSGLADALKLFENHGVILTHVESRASKDSYEFLVTCHNSNGHVTDIAALLRDQLNAEVQELQQSNKKAVPWFPTTLKDLDQFAPKVRECGEELDADHPGFGDPAYKARRKQFAEIAYNYRHGQEIPRIQYTKEETETWGKILTKLSTLHPKNACREFNQMFAEMKDECGYRPNNIPQLEDLSKFLQKRTGFRLRPAAGLLSARDFLSGLALRVFHATQYIRHSSKPFYTPEPDICHEVIGHVPLLADPSFAQFSQELGLASLGAPDEWIEKLSTIYWFTIEFGLCMEEGKRKAYGAGLLSGCEEQQYCMTDEPEVRDFDPEAASVQPYPFYGFQTLYYAAESLSDAQAKFLKWCQKIPRPFAVRYNPDTEGIEVIDNKDKVAELASKLQDDITVYMKCQGETSYR